MSNQNFRIETNNQKGGITAGIINILKLKNNKEKVSIIVVIMLIIAVLTFFGVDEMFGKDKTPSEVYNVESNNQQGGVTAGKIESLNVVNNPDSSKYAQPSNQLKRSIHDNLKSLTDKYKNSPNIIIEIESGSSLRDKVALDFEFILLDLNLGNYPKGNTFIGRFPDNPITIFYNAGNQQFVSDFIIAINPYIKGEFQVEPSDSFSSNFVKIYFNGVPSFDEDGSVIFQ